MDWGGRREQAERTVSVGDWWGLGAVRQSRRTFRWWCGQPKLHLAAPLLKTAWAFEAQLPLNEPVLTSFKGTTPWGPTLWAWKSSQGGNGTPQGPRAASFPSSGFLASSGAPPLEAWPQGPALRLKPPPAMSSREAMPGLQFGRTTAPRIPELHFHLLPPHLPAGGEKAGPSPWTPTSATSQQWCPRICRLCQPLFCPRSPSTGVSF